MEPEPARATSPTDTSATTAEPAGAPRSRLGEAAAAWCLLTRVPLMVGLAPRGRDFRDAVWAYPLVGAALGSVAGALGLAASMLLPGAVLPALIALGAVTLATGALHEDGLADSADGLAAGDDRARALAILRDSRIGSFGVLALLLVTALRVGALVTVPIALWPAALAASGAIGRASAGALLAALPPARTDGLAASVGRPGRAVAGVGVAIAAGLTLVLVFATGTPALLVGVVLAAGIVVGVGRMAARRLGGVTGDVCGAAVMLAETAVLLAAAAGTAP